MDYLVHHLLRASAMRWPNKEALIHEGNRLSYIQVEENTNRLADVLCGAGVERGDRVGIFFDHSVHQILSICGISKAGGVFVPINPLLLPDQVRHIVNDCGMKGIITSQAKLASLQQVVLATPSVRFLITTDGASNLHTTPYILGLEEILLSASDKPLPDMC